MDTNNNNLVRKNGAARVDWRCGGPRIMLSEQADDDVGWEFCRCMMHGKSQVGVPGQRGCGKYAVGNHPAVRVAEFGGKYVCHVSDETRAKDKQFFLFCRDFAAGSYMAYESDGAFVRARKRFATGSSGLDDFGRGYCHMQAIRDGYMNRVARVFGPNMYIADYLKVLCVAGKAMMVPLVLKEVAPGFLHVEQAQHTSGVYPYAGKAFYAKLVAYVKKNPLGRIGASVDKLVGEVSVTEKCSIQFGDFVVENTTEDEVTRRVVHWDNTVQQNVLSIVKEYLGETYSSALAQRLDVAAFRLAVGSGVSPEKNVVVESREEKRKSRLDDFVRLVEESNQHEEELSVYFRSGNSISGSDSGVSLSEALVNVASSSSTSEDEGKFSWADEMEREFCGTVRD